MFKLNLSRCKTICNQTDPINKKRNNYEIFVTPTSEQPLTDLRLRAAPRQILLAHRLLDAVHLVLVALAVAHRALLRLLQGRLQRLDAVHRRAQSLLQLGQLAAQVGVVAHQLLVHLGQLLQVVLQERDLLLLGQRAAVVLVVLGRDRLLDARLCAWSGVEWSQFNISIRFFL